MLCTVLAEEALSLMSHMCTLSNVVLGAVLISDVLALWGWQGVKPENITMQLGIECHQCGSDTQSEVGQYLQQGVVWRML